MKRITEATDQSYDALTGSGTVVVAFYMESPHVGRFDEAKKALASSAWQVDRSLRVVFVEYTACLRTWNRFGIGSSPTLWVLQDGVRAAEFRGGVFESMRRRRREAYDLNREMFLRWLIESLPHV